MKKFLPTLLLTAALLTGCSAGSTVMTYNDSVITENEFQYYLATYKGRFAQTFSDFSDTSAFYTSEITDGVTYEDYLFDVIVENIGRTLVCDALFDEMKLKLTDATIENIDAYLADYILEYAGGNKNQFNAALAPYGVNAKMLREIYLRDEKTSAVFDALYNANTGATPVTDADRAAYLTENYVRVRHIYVNNKYIYSTDADGYTVYTTDGLKQTEPMKGEELSAKNALIASIDEALAEGGDFEEVYQTFSEDKYYQNGYYLTRTTDFVSDVVSSAFELDEGEWVKLETDVGVHYIKRLTMDATPWTSDANKDFFDNYDTTVAEGLFEAYLDERIPGISYNEEILREYTVEESSTNYRF